MLTQKELSAKKDEGIAKSSMPPTKIRAFLEEFPWIEKLVKEPINQVYVSGVESSLLNYSPEQVDDGFIESHLINEIIFLLDEKWEVVTAEKEKKRRKFFFFGPCVSKIKRISGVVFPGSSVGSVVEQLGEKADPIYLIVSYYGYTKAVIIYRLPKGISLRQWIEREVELEKIEFQNVC